MRTVVLSLALSVVTSLAIVLTPSVGEAQARAHGAQPHTSQAHDSERPPIASREAPARRVNAAHAMGFVLTPLGGGGVLASLICFGMGALVEGPLPGTSTSTTDGTPFFLGGGIAGGLGLVALISGIILLVETPRWDQDSPHFALEISPTANGLFASATSRF